jgi:disulfide oxidoreductase YuzD
VDISNKNENIFYKSFKVKKIPDNITNEWRDGTIGFKLPEITNEMEYIKLYIWNVKKQDYFLDDIRLDFYTYDSP